MTRGAAPLQIVLCMDTEGPCADSARPDLLSSWEQVDAAMARLFDDRFRSRLPDPCGGHLRIGWFFLTWTGFDTNPRGRAFGYHTVRDHYVERWGARLDAAGDEHCWHYHHPAPGRVGNEWGTDWSVCREYDAIVSHQALDRDWFPVCYRAGGTIMDPVSSRWVDAWFPFDYSNRAPVRLEGLVDWSPGVADWSVYHPGVEDFRRPGAGRRHMARSLDLHTWIHALSDEEITAGFERAAAGGPAVVSCFDHDYRDIADRVDELRARVVRIAARYPAVPWQYASPVQAIRRYLDAPPDPPLVLELDASDSGSIHVRSSAPLYQAIPWLAVRTRAGGIVHVEEGIERIDPQHWRWTPTPDLDWIEAAVAGSTDLGASHVARIDSDRVRLERFRHPRSANLQASAVRSANASRDDEKLKADTTDEHPRSIWHHSTLFPELCDGRASGRLPETDSVAQTIALLTPLLRAGMRVLDAGCAAGHAWRSLAPLGVEYRGIDSCDRAIEIGRRHLASTGVAPDALRTLRLEDLPRGKHYDAVICLNTLSYFPMFHEPLDILANAADRVLVIRSSFGDRTEVRYLPDVLLDAGFQDLRAYFNIYSRDEVAAFLEAEGFRVHWIADRRQQERFGGRPEIVGGIELPAEFLFAERVRPRPSEDERLGARWAPLARAWRERRAGGPDR